MEVGHNRPVAIHRGFRQKFCHTEFGFKTTPTADTLPITVQMGIDAVP
jgi:hypothetical protein